jgi:hypothetical protein
MAVTKDDVKRVVARYLGPTHRSIVETYPTESAAAPKDATPKAGGSKATSVEPPPRAKKTAAKGSKAKKPATSAKKKK